jgi:hypothetical protein
VNWAVEVGSGAMIYIPSFIKIGSGAQILIGGIHRQDGDRVNLLKESKLIVVIFVMVVVVVLHL